MLVSPETAEAVERSDANRLGQDARFGHGAVAVRVAGIGGHALDGSDLSHDHGGLYQGARTRSRLARERLDEGDAALLQVAPGVGEHPAPLLRR